MSAAKAKTAKKKAANKNTDRDTLRLRVNEVGVAIVTIDQPDATQNTLRAESTAEFHALLDAIEADPAIRAVVVTSAKPDSFIAGADVDMIRAAKTKAEATQLSRDGQAAFARLEALRVPVVAAIHGACLGGGLELALACTARIASEDKVTKLGLPEVMLGLVPGAGGTQRLPRLIGIAAALDLVLTGKQLSARRAKKAGLVDDVVARAILEPVAIQKALALADAPAAAPTTAKQLGAALSRAFTAEGAQQLALEENTVGRRILFQQARKKTLAQTRGNYPAPERILDAIEIGYERGLDAGYDAEARFFGELAMSAECAGLTSLFRGITALKKDSGVDSDATPREVSNVGVLGAGLMGAGVAYVSVQNADVDVRLKDRDDAGLARGLQAIHGIYAKRVKRRRMRRTEAQRQVARVTTTTSYRGFEACDVIVEAVFEDLALKHQLLKDIEAVAPDAIFASNTSSIPIARIAAAAARPENVIGMHYFSPVEKMMLLEVIVTPETSDEVTATAVALGKKQGKHVIVVRDGTGFYTSRILAPYMNEAAWAISEGVPIEVVDQALMDWGFPVGPVTLLDEVGIDVASKIGPIMEEAFGSRMSAPGTANLLVKDGRLGRKSGKGFYRYDKPKPFDFARKRQGKKPVDESVYALLGLTPNASVDPDALAERVGLTMVNEAVRCLEEGILRSARDGDIGAVFGLGFPPFTGGPFRYVDHVGAAYVVDRLRALEGTHGERFAPARMLVDMAGTGARFHEA